MPTTNCGAETPMKESDHQRLVDGAAALDRGEEAHASARCATSQKMAPSHQQQGRRQARARSAR